ncbi:sulfite exporter TauE/SafE family protein [Alicyclobacillus ferrooxydans]|uniref:Probable membrane transporter protein n=1 Tax=Alicyclobacillus ferrooxydans TaxID=471514 RepID=A0A0P9EGY2_9BACL|nr:sulfite exporter TauE/SafE family protein [Alicyclobacillus ferrooxydans]KPV41796.1 permease [Alicyclobacillus ferrooxydans]
MTTLLILGVVFVVFLGALTRTTFGFGEAVVSMPLLTLLPVHLHTAIALMGLVGLTVALLAVSTGWRHINQRALIPLVCAALVGIPVGLLLVSRVPTQIMTGLLSLALMAYGIYSLTRHLFISTDQGDKLQHTLWGLLFGLASGVFGSAYNLNGVPVAVYGSLRGWNPQAFRSTMQAYFFISGALIVTGQGINGMWNANLFTLYLFSLPAMFAGILIGTALHRKIPTAKFQRYVFVLIAVLGSVLFIKSVV